MSTLCWTVLPSVLLALFFGATPCTAKPSAALPAFALPSLPASAHAEAVAEGGVPQLRATLLLSRAESSARAGSAAPVEAPARAASGTAVDAATSPARLGVLFELAPGWHLYWRNPGETGVAPDLDLAASGHSVGALAWPVPETFREADDLFTTYGYEDRVLLAASLSPDSRAATGDEGASGRARATVSVLVCRTQCVPASFTLESPLDVAVGPDERAVIEALFRESDARLAPPASDLGWRAEAVWPAGPPAIDEADRIALTLAPCVRGDSDCASASGAPRALAFLPFESETFEFASEQRASIDAASGRIELELGVTRLEAGEDRLRGLVAIRDASGSTRHAELDLPIGAAAKASLSPLGGSSSSAAPPRSAALEWIRILLLALLGGLILNGMPCVLPVLAIKVVSVADMAERSRGEVRMHGLAYTAGVLGSMLALAGLVVGLRSAGHAVGWGFQFQEPLFVAGIAALLVSFALNLFGVFEIELGQGRLAAVGQQATGPMRSVFEGLLAVVLATPCTAPFLGTAVGFAFASSGAGILGIFLAIGLGLASPFLLVSFFPALARFVPRSGPWMLKLRAGLGFCLLATVVWLLWILGQGGGTDAVVAMAGALLFLAFLLWLFGQLQPIRSRWVGRASAAGIALLAFASFNLIDFEPASAAATTSEPAVATVAAEDGFAPYSESAVREALGRGVPAFVVFTADWCITCKVNENTVLDRPVVREAFAHGGYALYKADWTRRDEAIRTKLAEFGRAGVPLYLVYDPATPDQPRVLSELLTEDAVLAALARPAGIERL